MCFEILKQYILMISFSKMCASKVFLKVLLIVFTTLIKIITTTLGLFFK